MPRRSCPSPFVPHLQRPRVSNPHRSPTTTKGRCAPGRYIPIVAGMDHFPDSNYVGTQEGPSLGGLLAIAVVLVLATMSAGLLVAGG